MADDRSLSDEDAVQRCVHETSSLVRDLRLPPLREFGLRPEHVAEMVSLAKKSSSMKYNPVTLSDETLEEILLGAIGG
jgi:alcohol dehydrogenase class IV